MCNTDMWNKDGLNYANFCSLTGEDAESEWDERKESRCVWTALPAR